ncbi:MAG: hypothetical protein WCK02_04855 [Bacteroidota bacterium]
MKTILILSFFILIQLFGYGQTNANSKIMKDTTYFSDLYNSKISIHYIDSNKSYREITIFYPNGSNKSKTEYLKARKHGLQVRWNENGSLIDSCQYDDGYQIIKRDMLDECFCNFPSYSRIGGENIYSLSEHFDRFSMDTIGVGQGRVLYRSDVALFIDSSGLKLSLTPERNGDNLAFLKCKFHQDNYIKDNLPYLKKATFTETPFEYLLLISGVYHQDLLISVIEANKNNTLKIAKFLKRNFNIDSIPFQINEQQIDSICMRINLFFENNDKFSDYEEFRCDFFKKYFNYSIKKELRDNSFEHIAKKYFPEYDENYPYKNLKKYIDGVFEIVLEPIYIAMYFPETLLRPWDKKRNVLLNSFAKKHYQSKLLISTSKLTYKSFPEEKIDIEEEPGSCFTTSEIAGTGIIVTSNGGRLDLNAKSIPWAKSFYPYYSFENYPAHLISKTIIKNDTLKNIFEPDMYLQNFMGAIIYPSNIKIPFKNRYIEASGSQWLIDGAEINGIIEIPTLYLPNNCNESIIKNHLKSLGLTIIEDYKPENPKVKSTSENIVIYFNFKSRSANN